MAADITFNFIWILPVFPLMVLYTLYLSRNLKLPRWRKNLLKFIRTLLLLFLTLALSAPSISHKPLETVTIFLTDLSDSLSGEQEKISEFVKDSIKEAGSKDLTGIISFSSKPLVEKMPSKEKSFDDFSIASSTDATDIEKALSLAMAAMPENTGKRLVLLSDGRETRGDSLSAARTLGRLGYTLDVVPFSSDIGYEVQMDSFDAPKAVNIGERFDITVRISSNYDTKGLIRLFENRTLSAEKEIDLYKGENLFTFTETAQSGGAVTYTAEVVTSDDTVYANNKLSSFTLISDSPAILIVEQDNSGENLYRYLKSYADIRRISPREIPSTINGLMAYDAYVLVDISMEDLDSDALNMIEAMVKNQGKGLLVTGGENSYAPGGYKNTVLEKILPVEMDITPKDENPDLGLVLVIDKSGSMSMGEYGISKLELAKEAAIRAVEVLEEKDSIGVIAFDDSIQWVINTTKLNNRKEVTDAMATIRPGGGTQILPPLEEAWLNLRYTDTRLKHIILLTDGQAEQHGYERIIEGIREDGITLSTVAVGKGADTLLLKALAYGGNGRYYQTDEFTDIPSIFAKETFLAGQKYLQNRTFYPEAISTMGLLKGIEAIPPLDGYVSTRAKALASTVFQSDTKEPVLSVWQYGLGRTAAWTSDIEGIWTSRWAAWPNAEKFWGNLAGWLVQKNISTGYSISSRIENGQGIITFQAESMSINEESLKGTVVSPDGSSKEISLSVLRPGLYEGKISDNVPGAYILNMQIPLDTGTEYAYSGIVLPYSDEYRLLGDNSMNMLQKLADAGGGSIVKDPAIIFKGRVQDNSSKRDLTNLFILMSLILLVIDIAVRKLQFRLEPVIAFISTKIKPFSKQSMPDNSQTSRKENSESTGSIKNLLNRRKHYK